MRPEELLQLIEQPNKISQSQAPSIKKLVEQYPYFQLAFALLAKAAYDQDPAKAQEAIQLASIYATDRNHLKSLLEGKLTFVRKQERQPSYSSSSSLANRQPTPNTSVKSEPDFINTYISTLHDRESQQITKAKSLEQWQMIENFMQQGGQFSSLTARNIVPDQAPADLSQHSSNLPDDIITESLAQIMTKQGKVQRALEIYAKLQVKFPEKKSYFAALSEALKKEIS